MSASSNGIGVISRSIETPQHQKALQADDLAESGRVVTIVDQYPWRKATGSQAQEACVEVAPLPTATGIRDTKDRAGGHLEVGPAAWTELVRQGPPPSSNPPLWAHRPSTSNTSRARNQAATNARFSGTVGT
ncbi:DUF397 domain-containing protein [Embleya sp. AB8]|uniref:DUF397 domain-containing protein n=1 Tax=Embleya sp. AB8 TaxID=3156304 RepID=UPI003C7967BC